MKTGKIVLLTLFALLIAAFFILDLGQYFNLEYIKTQQSEINNYYQTKPLITAVSFLLIYIVVTTLSLPGAGIMTLASGVIFGLSLGTLLVAIAAPIGATFAFLTSRYILRDWVQTHYHQHLKPINDGIKHDGGFYLFTLRLVPVFPFFIINLLMGLTPIKLITYYVVTLIGMLPATAIFVNAGTQIATINSLGDILSLKIFLSLALLGIFPLIARLIVNYIQARKTLVNDTDIIDEKS